MPPELTDEQIRADEAAQHSATAYNQILGDMSRGNHAGPAFASMMALSTAEQRRQLVEWARNAYGDNAAREMLMALNSNIIIDPMRLIFAFADQYPRIDAGRSPAPAPAPAAPPTAAGVADDERLWLPGNASLPAMSAQDSAALDTLDAAVEAHNVALFGVDPRLARIPEGARLPVTGTNISTLGTAYDKASALIPLWHTRVEELRAALEGSGEALINDQLDAMRAAITQLSGAAEDSRALNTMIAAAGVAANDAFHQLRGEALTKRDEIAQVSRGETETFADIPAVASRLDKADDATQKGRAIGALAARIPAPITAVDAGAAAGGAPPAAAVPAASSSTAAPERSPAAGAVPAGAAAAAGAGSPSASRGGDDLAKLLAALGNGAAAPSLPIAPAQALAPLGQAAQQAAKPLAQATEPLNQAVKAMPEELLKALRGADAGNDRLPPADTAAARAADTDRAAATSPTVVLPPPAPASGLGVPGSEARPHQLDANGKPADKDGDGKVDEDAVPLSKATVAPFDLAVSADGANVRAIGVPDPRLGEMMLHMAGASDDQPVSVLDAAKAAGMDITALGSPLDPAEARTGDAVIGPEKSGIYLGDGRVLTSTGEVTDLDTVIGADGFVAAVPLPELPDDVPADGPAPAQTTVSSAPPESPPPLEPLPPHTPAPAGDVTPAAHSDPAPAPAPPPASPPAPAPVAGPDPAPAPEVTPVSQASPASDNTTTAGEDTALPRQVPYEGRALG